MQKHILSHNVENETSPLASGDDDEDYFTNLSYLLLHRRVLSKAIHYGNGELVILVIKFHMPVFKAAGCTLCPNVPQATSSDESITRKIHYADHA